MPWSPLPFSSLVASTYQGNQSEKLSALNVLKYLSHPSCGCNRKILLPLYRALIRSILDYGSTIYGLAPSSQLSLLHSLFRSKRSHPHLYERFSYYPHSKFMRRIRLSHSLTSSFLTSVAQIPDTSILDILFNSLHQCLNYRKSFTHIFLNQSQANCLLPIFPARPPWIMTPSSIILKLCESPKKDIPATIYHAHFLEILDSLRDDAIPCLTDGSKIGYRTGFAFSIGNNIF